MKKTGRLLSFLYRHSFVRYAFVGGTTFMLDIALLVFFYEAVNTPLALATSLAYWLSIMYNFGLNRWWAFEASEEKRLHQHLALYLMLLGFNYTFTVLFVSIVSQDIHYGAAKVVATAIQIGWTYPIYKYAIFDRRNPPTIQGLDSA